MRERHGVKRRPRRQVYDLLGRRGGLTHPNNPNKFCAPCLNKDSCSLPALTAALFRFPVIASAACRLVLRLFS